MQGEFQCLGMLPFRVWRCRDKAKSHWFHTSSHLREDRKIRSPAGLSLGSKQRIATCICWSATFCFMGTDPTVVLSSDKQFCAHTPSAKTFHHSRLTQWAWSDVYPTNGSHFCRVYHIRHLCRRVPLGKTGSLLLLSTNPWVKGSGWWRDRFAAFWRWGPIIQG